MEGVQQGAEKARNIVIGVNHAYPRMKPVVLQIKNHVTAHVFLKSNYVAIQIHKENV